MRRMLRETLDALTVYVDLAPVVQSLNALSADVGTPLVGDDVLRAHAESAEADDGDRLLAHCTGLQGVSVPNVTDDGSVARGPGSLGWMGDVKTDLELAPTIDLACNVRSGGVVSTLIGQGHVGTNVSHMEGTDTA